MYVVSEDYSRRTYSTSTKYQVPSTKYQVPSTKYQVPSTKYQVPSTKYQVPAIQRLMQLYSCTSDVFDEAGNWDDIVQYYTFTETELQFTDGHTE
jgi:hypothetical protein